MAQEPLQASTRHGSGQSEIQFRHLLEALPAGAYTCDPQGLITYFNRHAVRLWGREPKLNDPDDRFCGSFMLFSSDGSPIAHNRCWMALALETGQEYNGEEIIIERADGSRLTVLAHANPIRNESGAVIGAVNVLVDISDREESQAAQRLLASIVESSDDAIIAKTLDGQILSWNAGAERLFGYAAHEAIGSPITIVIPPEKWNEERSILERLRRGERIDHFETIRRTKQGRLLDISLTISPIRDSTGRITAASKVARDITARKNAAEALVSLKDELATQLADLRRLHEMSLHLSTTLELRPILEEFLRTAAAIEGTDLGLLSLCDANQNELHVGVGLGFSAEFMQAIERAPSGRGPCGTCFRERRRVVVENIETDPRFAAYREVARWAGFRAVHSTPLITRSGDILGVLSTHFRQSRRPSNRETHLIELCARQAVDFIENARLYRQLWEADRRKDEFLATLAHELRNPLAPISNSLHLLRLTSELSPSAERVRQIMERQVGHMVRLVDDLLEISRVTRGKMELRKEPVELAAVIHSAVETSQPLIEVAGHQLAITVPHEPITLEADPLRLTQVISNLLNNAAKYTKQNGQIWLTARLEGDEAAVSVRDNGIGIAKEHLPRIFEMFSQITPSLDRMQGGLGIGLALARALVELHGGRIEAKSDGLGRGSEFIVRLPLAPATLFRAERRTNLPQSVGTARPARRVVVVDDTRAAVYTLARLLETMGQHVRTANNAATALELVRNERPDLVISDLAMPNMNGYELAQRLRQDPALSGLVLVALTGYGQESNRRQAKEAGFDYYLVKPVSLEALETMLDSLPAPSPADVTTPERPNAAPRG
jgi:PAS domain S-box-containing protein